MKKIITLTIIVILSIPTFTVAESPPVKRPGLYASMAVIDEGSVLSPAPKLEFITENFSTWVEPVDRSNLSGKSPIYYKIHQGIGMMRESASSLPDNLVKAIIIVISDFNDTPVNLKLPPIGDDTIPTNSRAYKEYVTKLIRGTKINNSSLEFWPVVITGISSYDRDVVNSFSTIEVGSKKYFDYNKDFSLLEDHLHGAMLSNSSMAVYILRDLSGSLRSSNTDVKDRMDRLLESTNRIAVEQHKETYPVLDYLEELTYYDERTYWIGSPESDPYRNPDETYHAVRLEKYGMGEFISQELFAHYSDKYLKQTDPLRPVNNVDYPSAIRFAIAFAKDLGLDCAYAITEDGQITVHHNKRNCFALPTEAEAEIYERNKNDKTDNEETRYYWCEEEYSGYRVLPTPELNPAGPEYGTSNAIVVRGFARPSERGRAEPDQNSPRIGIRLVWRE
jgi:hypothetical protein